MIITISLLLCLLQLATAWKRHSTYINITDMIPLSDHYDHILLDSIQNCNNETNKYIMNLNNFDKFINWNGIYDLIDHGMWLAIVNGSIKNDTTLSFDLNRDQKAQLIVNYIDNKHVAFRGLGNESQIIYPNFHPNYAVRSLLQTIYNLLNLFKSLLKLFFRIRNYSTVHICGGSVHWYNNYNQNSNVIITYIIALIPKMNFDNRCNINISNNLKSQSFKHFQTSLIFKHYNRIDDTLTHFDIEPYWRVDFVYRFWIPRNKYNYANLWEISRVPTYFESS